GSPTWRTRSTAMHICFTGGLAKQAGSVLVDAAGREPQRDALGSGAVRTGRLPSAGAWQRMAAAPRGGSAQRAGRSAGRGCRLAEIHKLYRCHDRLLGHKQAVFDHLVGRWRDLFNISYDVLLYASSHQVKHRIGVFPSLFTSLATARGAR